MNHIKTIPIHLLAASLILALTTSFIGEAWAGGEKVKFPESYAEGVLYTTVHRGKIKEDIYTGRTAIEAVKAGQPIPSGTVITLVDYRDGELYRYVVMEKRSGWGTQYPESYRNGEWEYQAYNADGSVNDRENLIRCFQCHKSEAPNDFVFTFEHMKDDR